MANTSSASLKLFELVPKDRNEPPFHFHNVVGRMLVMAASARAARELAAHEAGDHGEAWRNEKLTSCAEMVADDPGVVAREMTA